MVRRTQDFTVHDSFWDNMLFAAAFYLWNATKSILPQVREKLIVGGLMKGGL